MEEQRERKKRKGRRKEGEREGERKGKGRQAPHSYSPSNSELIALKHDFRLWRPGCQGGAGRASVALTRCCACTGEAPRL